MNFFQSLWVSITNVFKSREAKAIGEATLLIAKTTATRYADKLAKVAYKEVKQAELAGAEDKYERVFKAVRGTLSARDIKDQAINAAIEITLGLLEKQIAKYGRSALSTE
jgi:hypothetical protein